jgi:hypothetical protein
MVLLETKWDVTVTKILTVVLFYLFQRHGQDNPTSKYPQLRSYQLRKINKNCMKKIHRFIVSSKYKWMGLT